MEELAGCTVIDTRRAAVPVPCNAAVCGLLLALSVMVRVPVLVPVIVGAKVTVTVQLDLAPSGLGQLLVWLKPAPVAAMLLISKGTSPVFCILTFVVAVELRATLPKEILFVESETV